MLCDVKGFRRDYVDMSDLLIIVRCLMDEEATTRQESLLGGKGR